MKISFCFSKEFLVEMSSCILKVGLLSGEKKYLKTLFTGYSNTIYLGNVIQNKIRIYTLKSGENQRKLGSRLTSTKYVGVDLKKRCFCCIELICKGCHDAKHAENDASL